MLKVINKQISEILFIILAILLDWIYCSYIYLRHSLYFGLVFLSLTIAMICSINGCIYVNKHRLNFEWWILFNWVLN